METEGFNDTEGEDEDVYDISTIAVDRGQKPLRLDRFLMDRLSGVSRNKIQQAIAAGMVKVNEQEVKSNYKVRPEDQITYLTPRYDDEGTTVVPEEIPLEIIYEDQQLLVINKPAGLVVHPGVGNRSGTLVNALAFYFLNRDLPVLEGNPENRPGLVHRLDKNTSGLMVIAKTEHALTHLAKQFFHHTTERAYLALIWGQPEQDQGTISSYIGRDPRYRQKQKVVDTADQGKWAITHYKTLEALYYVSLVECRLETGRTHQIRVHMRHLGHPLFGDDKYDGDRIRKGTVFQKYKQFVQNCFELMPHQALHAASLGFEHPTTGERMLFHQPFPDAFGLTLERWRKYVGTRKSELNE